MEYRNVIATISEAIVDESHCYIRLRIEYVI